MVRIEGNIVDIVGKEIFEGSVEAEKGIISAVRRHPTKSRSYIMPGFVDAHVHIESSMLTPENFGRAAIRQGTVAVVTDPHEIANVMGAEGIEFMMENNRRSPLKTFFTIPSCVPATSFDRAGGTVSSEEVARLAASGRFVGLSEMMDVPGVLSGDREVMAKLDAARRFGLPMDGHAPLLSGARLAGYAGRGISTDHECVSLAEAEEKIALGMKILIREGSAACNYEALKPLIRTHPDRVMFCTDDSHPREILSGGHLRRHVAHSVADGFDLFDVLRIASLNPVRHYGLDVGLLQAGDKADFIVVDDLETFEVQQVYIGGTARPESTMSPVRPVMPNRFAHEGVTPSSLRKAVDGPMQAISLIDGEILTRAVTYSPGRSLTNLECDPAEDIAKIVYVNRYDNGIPQVAFCKGSGLRTGALASSVSHDSHNIIAVGCSDEELAGAINAVVECKGGIAVCRAGKTEILPLPIGGIMSDRSAEEVDTAYRKLERMAAEMGCTLGAPFMTLSFLSLVVIPELRIGERGLFSYSRFDWI